VFEFEQLIEGRQALLIVDAPGCPEQQGGFGVSGGVARVQEFGQEMLVGMGILRDHRLVELGQMSRVLPRDQVDHVVVGPELSMLIRHLSRSVDRLNGVCHEVGFFPNLLRLLPPPLHLRKVERGTMRRPVPRRVACISAGETSQKLGDHVGDPGESRRCIHVDRLNVAGEPRIVQVVEESRHCLETKLPERDIVRIHVPQALTATVDIVLRPQFRQLVDERLDAAGSGGAWNCSSSDIGEQTVVVGGVVAKRRSHEHPQVVGNLEAVRAGCGQHGVPVVPRHLRERAACIGVKLPERPPQKGQGQVVPAVSLALYGQHEIAIGREGGYCKYFAMKRHVEGKSGRGNARFGTKSISGASVMLRPD
jgi:hypothetical protein